MSICWSARSLDLQETEISIDLLKTRSFDLMTIESFDLLEIEVYLICRRARSFDLLETEVCSICEDQDDSSVGDRDCSHRLKSDSSICHNEIVSAGDWEFRSAGSEILRSAGD